MARPAAVVCNSLIHHDDSVSTVSELITDIGSQHHTTGLLVGTVRLDVDSFPHKWFGASGK